MQSNYQIMSKAIDIDQILESIPHEKPFRFIDGLETVSEEISEATTSLKKKNTFIKVIIQTSPSPQVLFSSKRWLKLG